MPENRGSIATARDKRDGALPLGLLQLTEPTLDAIYRRLAEVEETRLGHIAVGDLQPVPTVYGDLLLPDRVAQHRFRETALRFSQDLWQQRLEVAVVLGPQYFAISKGIRTRVELPAAPKGEPDPVTEALVVHNHPRRQDYAGDLGPSGNDLALLLRRGAAGLVLVSPGALWIVGFPRHGEEPLPWAVPPEAREILLERVMTAGSRCLASRRYRVLKHLAALTLSLLGTHWVRYPRGKLAVVPARDKRVGASQKEAA